MVARESERPRLSRISSEEEIFAGESRLQSGNAALGNADRVSPAQPGTAAAPVVAAVQRQAVLPGATSEAEGATAAAAAAQSASPAVVLVSAATAAAAAAGPDPPETGGGRGAAAVN